MKWSLWMTDQWGNRREHHNRVGDRITSREELKAMVKSYRRLMGYRSIYPVRFTG